MPAGARAVNLPAASAAKDDTSGVARSAPATGGVQAPKKGGRDARAPRGDNARSATNRQRTTRRAKRVAIQLPRPSHQIRINPMNAHVDEFFDRDVRVAG